MKTYKLKPQVVAVIKENPILKNNLCQAMNIDMPALYYHLSNNLPNGSLTKLCALLCIADFIQEDITKLCEQSQLIRA